MTNLLDDIPVPLYGDGGNVRDWLHVLDHCRAVDFVIARGASGEVYNIGGGNEVKNLDLTHRILQLLDKPASLIRPVAGPARVTIGATRSIRASCAPSAGRRRRRSNPGWPRRWSGIARTSGGGGRSKSATPRSRRITKRSTAAAPAPDPWLADPILVTGAAGFVGSHLLDRLQHDQVPLVGWRRPVGPPARELAGVRWMDVELLDRDAVRHGDRRDPALGGLPPGRRAACRAVVAVHARDLRRQRPRDASSVRRLARGRPHAARADPVLGLRLRAAVAADPRRRPAAGVQPVRDEQDRAGDAGPARVGGGRSPDPDRACVQSHRAASGSELCRGQHRPADRAHRSRTEGARARRSATWNRSGI